MSESHEHEHEHEHVKFESASLISARLCTSCGSYVSSAHLGDHQDFHDQVAAARTEATQDTLF